MASWVLTETSFDKLLDCLGKDREQAGAAYEAIRRKLTRFFEWRGAASPEERVDETFNRVARKLEDGVAILNPAAYCNEVARLVLLESFKRPEPKLTSLEDLEPQQAAKLVSVMPSAMNDDSDREARLGCLEICLSKLPAENWELIVEFYRDERRAKIDGRNALAARVGEMSGHVTPVLTFFKQHIGQLRNDFIGDVRKPVGDVRAREYVFKLLERGEADGDGGDSIFKVGEAFGGVSFWGEDALQQRHRVEDHQIFFIYGCWLSLRQLLVPANRPAHLRSFRWL